MLINVEKKHLKKIQYLCMIFKNMKFSKLGIEGKFLNLIKNIYKIPTPNITLNGT